MNVRIRKVRKPKKRKTKRSKKFKPTAPKRPRAQVEGQNDEDPQKVVVMAEFTNGQENTSTIYVCSSPAAALKKAIIHICTSGMTTGLRELNQNEANMFVAAVGKTDYDQALSIWSAAQERSGEMGGVWFSCEIWSAAVHDEPKAITLFAAADRAWQQRVATQSEANA